MGNKLLNTPWGENEINAVRAVLVSVITGRTTEREAQVSLDELERLLETAGGSAFARLTQSKDSPDPATVIGSGKIKELYELCSINDVPLVVFDMELTPSQIKNIEDALSDDKHDVMVIDRAMLILDIFALHAQSSEGKLQVELAQLRYTAPRLIGKGLQLSRQVGGNIAVRGPGETKLETDRRYIERRIQFLEEQLRKLDSSRSTMRKARQRSGITSCAIVGYTNAGKSTLLNYLTGAGILAEDKLFATLDPTTRRYKLPSGEEILLTDTVGFIRNLPHHLIKAFKSTLDEVKFADIILVLIDASDPECQNQLKVSKELLRELGVEDKPIIYVWNKCDAESDRLLNVVWDQAGSLVSFKDTVAVSAKTGEGIDELIAKLEEAVSHGRLPVTYRIPNIKSGELSRLYNLATVTNVNYTHEYIEVDTLSDNRARGVFSEYVYNSPDNIDE
ncbi:MAG: GTPase HflX [Clostridiales bacterium]|nr:GTPase HflX [Clostridiales bacterium]